MFGVDLFLARETKRTVRYESEEDSAPITVLYIQKSALPVPYPSKITVSVDK
jgi:hypothetical protein